VTPTATATATPTPDRMVQMPPREYLEMFANADSIDDLPDGSAEDQILHFKGEDVGDYTTYGGNWTLARLLSTGIHENGEDHYALPTTFSWGGPQGYGVRLEDDQGLTFYNGTGGDLDETSIATPMDIALFLEGTNQERQNNLQREERLIGSLFADFSTEGDGGRFVIEDFESLHQKYLERASPDQYRKLQLGFSENAMMFYDEEDGEQIFDNEHPPLFLDNEAWDLLSDYVMPTVEDGPGKYGVVKTENPLAYLVGREGRDENGIMEAVHEAEVGAGQVAGVGVSSDGNRFEVKTTMHPDNASYEEVIRSW
jgi:hypothetical protein